MAEQAAHLVDAVLPWVPVRQWVPTVPHRLRYRLAFDSACARPNVSQKKIREEEPQRRTVFCATILSRKTPRPSLIGRTRKSPVREAPTNQGSFG
jgi:hypothetical protein